MRVSPCVVQAPYPPAQQPVQQPPRAASLSEEGEEMLLQFFAVKDTPSSEEIRFLARQVRFCRSRSLQMDLSERRMGPAYRLHMHLLRCSPYVLSSATARCSQYTRPVTMQLEPAIAIYPWQIRGVRAWPCWRL